MRRIIIVLALLFTCICVGQYRGGRYDNEGGSGSGDVTVTGTPEDGQVAIWTAADDIEGTSALTFDGTTVDVNSGGLVLQIGADSGASTRTNNTNKLSSVGAFHYANAEEPFGVFYTQSTSLANNLYWGSGVASLNAATSHLFYAAADTTTTTGTLVGTIDVTDGITSELGIVTKNGATTGGFVDYYEDSDSGTDKARVIAPALSADITLTLPDATGTFVTDTDLASEAETAAAVIDIIEAGNIDYTGENNFSAADVNLPVASPAVPTDDGGVELDMTDGTLVIQNSSSHAELGASTDIVYAKIIKSFSGTITQPDTVNDVLTVKAINSIEFPHGVVITAIYLGVSENTTYVLTVQNFDDFDTINAGNGTIDTVTYTADTTGEIIDSTPTYATIAAGQLIMISIPATDVDWIHFEIYYYEPAA